MIDLIIKCKIKILNTLFCLITKDSIIFSHLFGYYFFFKGHVLLISLDHSINLTIDLIDLVDPIIIRDILFMISFNRSLAV